MATTVGDFLLQRLGAWGIKRIFGYPGDGINGIMGALKLLEDELNDCMALTGLQGVRDVAAGVVTAQPPL